MKKLDENGQILAGILVLLLVISTLIPVLIMYSQREAIWTSKQNRNTTAFHLAESGVEKGYLAVASSTSAWSTIQLGQQLTGYHFDRSYSDIDGGTYTVAICSGPTEDSATVIAIGRDKYQKETRALKVVYAGFSVNAAMYAASITFGGGPTAEWGPMMSLGNMSFSGASDICYPKKYAVGNITGMSAACHANAPGNAYSGSQPPCTDSVEWWVYNCSPGVPPGISIDLDSYKSSAQNSSCPTASGFPSGASPANSCYWPVASNPTFSGVVMVSSKTVYIDADLTVHNGFLYGDVIVAGALTFTGNASGAGYTATVPPSAFQHYQKVDTAATGEYVGDNGYQTLSATIDFNVSGGKKPSQCTAGSTCRTGTSTNPYVHGFVYAGGTITATGGCDIHGVVFSPASQSGLGGNSSVWYDPTVASGIRMATSYPTQQSWQDIFYAWPSGL